MFYVGLYKVKHHAHLLLTSVLVHQNADYSFLTYVFHGIHSIPYQQFGFPRAIVSLESANYPIKGYDYCVLLGNL
jgi:hypothetical protein